MSDPVVRIGVAGLGRAFTLMLPTFRADARVRLIAAADPRPEACARFAVDFGARTYPSVENLCDDADVDLVYVATPHELHAEHVAIAARAGKHVLVEKPMAITLGEAQAMVDACEGAGTWLIVGHSHSFDAPILRARALIAEGAVGRLRMITALNFTDYMYRPRRPEELATAAGGGVLFSQAAHQIDIVRLLGGGRLASVRAQAGIWDPARPTEGAYCAFATFEDGTCATLTYSGYAHYDSDELTQWVSELGFVKDPSLYGAARRALAEARDATAETALKNARNYGGPAYSGRDDSTPARVGHQQFGFVLASCEHGDVRPLPKGVMIYGDGAPRLEALPVSPVPRVEVIDEVHAALTRNVRPVHDGRWALATLEACLALLASSRTGREVSLAHQVALHRPQRNTPPTE